MEYTTNAKAMIKELLQQMAGIDASFREQPMAEGNVRLLRERLIHSVDLLTQCLDWETFFCIENDGIPISSEEDSEAIDAILNGYNNYLRILPGLAEDVGRKTLKLIESVQQAQA